MALINLYYIPKKVFLSGIFITLLLVFNSCKDSSETNETISGNKQEEMLFTSIPATESGLDFQNRLEETLEANYFQYNYTYIGGGVATADFNNDGLVDIFFTSNSYDNKLYLNKGNLKFEDITQKAGIEKRDGFDTGVTVVDVNNDGYLDIYLSRGGAINTNNEFANMLYINNGDLTFTEKAEELGLADDNRTINAIFFDYDNDNDLDVYVSNASDIVSRRQTEVLDLVALRSDPETLAQRGSDRLYNNDGTGHFTDVSKKAGIFPETGFGLNPEIMDFNNDGWLDIYVNNDFGIPDFALLNNGDGTFTESRDELFKHMSFNSMGGDVADMNNDGLLDLMTLDMNPEDYVRSKTTMGMTPIDKFEAMVAGGYHYQYMHNMLHINNGNGTFSEISKMADMGDTDWSWALLSADFDLDGFNDIFVTNGVFRDVIDKDKNNEILQILRYNNRKPTKEDFFEFAKMFPQQKLTNYFFRNKGDLTFEDTSKTWAIDTPTFSNGAAYADFDNDGDLDLIINNINDDASLLKNNAIELDKGKFLKLKFKGPEKNNFGVGVVANIHLNNGQQQTRQLINTRGFLSAVSNEIHFGINPNDSIDQLEIVWMDGKKQIINYPKSNKLLEIDYSNASLPKEYETEKKELIFNTIKSDFKHKDLYTNDYQLQILLPHKLSQTGPAIAKADVNNDGIIDMFLGGARSFPGQLWLGQDTGGFKAKKIKDFEMDNGHEDVGAAFFDADNDGDQDLYVVSGSYELYGWPRFQEDRLYLNNGDGSFKKATDKLPTMVSSGSVVVPNDYDKDGDIDLFVGGRVIPGQYPYPPTSYLLLNEGGTFTIATPELAPELETIGMVTDAYWADLNNDKAMDLVVTGEWMGIEVFINQNNKLVKSDAYGTLSNAVGWWNRLLIEDIDNDGDLDIIAGNLGLNYKFHASPEEPFHVYTTDFDLNGTADIILAKKYEGREVPIRGKTCMTQQIPHLARKIPTYADFASKDVKGIVGERIESALHYQATEFRSGIFRNNGNDGFAFEPFINQVQISIINSIVYDDFDGDGIKDLVMAGNNHHSEVETTRADAGIGSFLKGNGSGNFDYISNRETGFFADKDVRNMMVIDQNGDKLLFVANNNDTHQIFKVHAQNNKN